jgi:hypothetical protein
MGARLLVENAKHSSTWIAHTRWHVLPTGAYTAADGRKSGRHMCSMLRRQSFRVSRRSPPSRREMWHILSQKRTIVA